MIIYYISDAIRSRFSAEDAPRFSKERASANDRDWIDSPGELALRQRNRKLVLI